MNTANKNIIMRNVGGRVRALRQERQMTLPGLAEAAGLSKGLLSKMENSSDANPSLATLQKIAEALDVTLADLLDRDKVTARRLIPDAPPSWLKPLIDSLKSEGREPDEDCLQALFVLQRRKGQSAIKAEKWRWLYDSIEMSFKH